MFFFVEFLLTNESNFFSLLLFLNYAFLVKIVKENLTDYLDVVFSGLEELFSFLIDV